MNIQKLINFLFDYPFKIEVEYLKQLKIWDDTYSPARLIKE